MRKCLYTVIDLKKITYNIWEDVLKLIEIKYDFEIHKKYSKCFHK